MKYPLSIPEIEAPRQFARFLRRPNRFVAEIELLPEGKITTASLPNPGRMQEIFLLDRKLIPGLENRRVGRAEVTPPGGGSRFDFEMVSEGEGKPPFETHQGYLEVKSCTLFNGPWALFPDAVTDRGRKHVAELADHPGSVILFLIHSAQVEFFSPDIHVDLAFSRTLHAHRNAVQIYPVALDWGQDMKIQSPPKLLAVPWERIESGLKDRGSYLAVLRVSEEQTLDVGALGSRTFSAGYYVYVGSAMQHLSRRVDRHRVKRRARKHWHLDYLREFAEHVATYAIREPHRREEEIAIAMETVSADSIPGFGSSDSSRPSHLFRFDDDPRTDARFQEIVLRLRRRVFD